MASGRAPFPWFGGKQHLAPLLLEVLPPHEVYVEVFGGAASLLFSKRPSRLEVYNDIDSGLVNFFRVLRDPKRAAELYRLLEHTPYSREEWQACSRDWPRARRSVDKAWGWFVALTGTFSQDMMSGKAGWSYSRTPNSPQSRKFRGYCHDLPHFAKRLQRVQVEHLEALDLIARYDGPRVLFYLDPPYLPSTRSSGGYRHEMTQQAHEALLERLTQLQGMAVLSGYRSDLYDHYLEGWRRIDYVVQASAAKAQRVSRRECIWLSPSITRHQSELWSA